MKFLMAFILVMVATMAAFAQAVLPVPTPTPATLSDALIGVLGLVKSWGTVGMYAGIATALKLLVDIVKATGLFDKIPAKWQALSVLLVGTLTVGLTTLAAGGTVPQAVSASFGSSAGAILIHEIWADLFPKKDVVENKA